MPAVLEMLGIPYSGSDPLTLAASLDKEVAKRLVRRGGRRAPRGCSFPAGLASGEVEALDARRKFDRRGRSPMDRQARLRRVEQGDPRAAASPRPPPKPSTIYPVLARDYGQPILSRNSSPATR